MVPGAIIVLCLGAAGLLAAGAPDPATSPSEEVTESRTGPAAGCTCSCASPRTSRRAGRRSAASGSTASAWTRVRWSLAHLEAVSARLDDGRLQDAGIEPVGWGPAIRRNRVDLEAVTRRSDAAEVVRELYGDEVHLEILGPSFYRTRCGVPAHYRVAAVATLALIHGGGGSAAGSH